MKRILTGVIIFLVGIASGLILSYGSLQAQSSADSEVMSRLNEIAKTQQDVLAAVNSMKEDIQIIKIRVTQIQ